MEIHLVIVRPFAGFARGDVVTDPARIISILSSENAHFVVRVAARMPGGA
jgi:hypothetical protein